MNPPDAPAAAQAKRAQPAVSLLAFLVVAVAILLAVDLPSRLGVLIYTEQFVALVLGASLAICFLRYSVRSSRPANAPPWYNAVLAGVSLYAGLHLAIRYPQLSQDFYSHPQETLFIGCLLIPLLVEGLRRSAGWGLVAVVAVFLVYGVTAHLVPGPLRGMSSSLPDLLSFLAIDSTAVFGTPLIIVVTIVVTFILFGNLLLATGGSEWFTDLSTAVVGRTRGGSAKIAVVASALFGSISGSAVANVASTGVVTIPLMKRAGFGPRVAGAFEAVASTGGQIMPPVMGAAAFLMAEFLQVPYAEVVVAATVPAILFFLAVLIQADLEAAHGGIPPIPADMIRPLRTVLKEGWYFVAPFAVLIIALFGWNMPPAKAALWAGGSLMVLNAVFGYRGRRTPPPALWQALLDTGRASVEIVVIGAAAGVVIGVFENTGLSFGLTFLMVEFGRSSLLLLLVLTGIICILLGMGMPTTGIYLLVATLAAPPLIQLGVEPMAAHLFILYFGLLSMISPPVAVAAFAAASIARAGPMETAMTAVRIGWPAFIIPFLFVYSPSLLLQGDILQIVAAIVTAVAGIWLISAAVVGYLRRRLAVLPRLAVGATGLLLLVPANAFPGAVWLDVAGVVSLLAMAGFGRAFSARAIS